MKIKAFMPTRNRYVTIIQIVHDGRYFKVVYIDIDNNLKSDYLVEFEIIDKEYIND